MATVDDSPILDELNERQCEAVAAPLNANLVVLAGAGSGKTRVLTHRIAYLITHGVSPYSILAVTFTNKAANEMRHRIEEILEFPTRSMWVGTFHGLAHRLLRAHWQEAGLKENFQILDSEDQYRLIRRVLKEMGLDEDQWLPKQIQWFINGKKDEGQRPNKVPHHGDFYTQRLVDIYQQYQDACEQAGLVDFAELLLRSYELWQTKPHILKHYQERFHHVLVDEFQDTNAIQYNWIKLLFTGDNSIMVVGDDDQSIYGWRGAKIENIHKIERDFPGTKIIRLEQNYRSTGTILNAANALIQNNLERMGKNLWTNGNSGEPIMIYSAFNEIDEARYITDAIKKWVAEGNRRDEVAILYRSNAQSRVLEEALIQQNIPYRVYGGLRFFERAEIKDALAYLRLLVNRDDDPAFERIVNTPTRGIGNTTMEQIRELSREKKLTLWQAAQHAVTTEVLSARASNAVSSFVKLIDQMQEETESYEPGEVTEHVLQASGLIGHYRKSKGEKALARVENLEELVSATRQFKPEQDSELPLLQAFLSHAALEAGETQGQSHEDCVQLMTLHSAKGLEFPMVFISGMEEGLFPHHMVGDDPKGVEEERRLCYVGITRAKQRLHLTYAEVRRMYGSESYHRSSRFIAEIPAELIQEVRLKATVTRPYIASTFNTQSKTLAKRRNQMAGIDQSGFQIGARVNHKKFGEGIVLATEGSGDNARIQVNFSNAGSKWLLASYINQV